MIDYDLLLEGCCEIGCRMLACGAEIYRVEDTVHRLLAAYHIDGEVFAIPNCLIISIADGEGRLHTRMHRAKPPQTDIALIESYNALSRRLCADPPKDPGRLLHEVYLIEERKVTFPLWIQLVGYFIGASFFSLFFGGGLPEALAGGMAGLLAGLTVSSLGKAQWNYFLSTLLAGFVLAAFIAVLAALGLPLNRDITMAGGLMALVPGLVFTNFLSDLLAGDVVAGLSTFVRAMLTAAAIALGTLLAMALSRVLPVPAPVEDAVDYGLLWPCIFAAVACYGFCFSFNIRGRGAILCCLGGGLGWFVYLAAQQLTGGGVFTATLIAAIVVAAYAEVMARVRKCPATAYLLVSFFPLVPGLTIYHALDFGLKGDLANFWESFFRTFGIAGCLALGSLIVTSVVRNMRHRRRH